MVGAGTQQLWAHQRLLLHASGWALSASGIVWLGLHHLAGVGPDQLPHPLESWTMRLHALAAWVGVFTLGELAASHVPRGWHATMRRRARVQRCLGLALCGLAAVLVLGGYALMYWVPESRHAAWGWAHAVLGVLMAGVLVVHGSGEVHHRHA